PPARGRGWLAGAVAGCGSLAPAGRRPRSRLSGTGRAYPWPGRPRSSERVAGAATRGPGPARGWVSGDVVGYGQPRRSCPPNLDRAGAALATAVERVRAAHQAQSDVAAPAADG